MTSEPSTTEDRGQTDERLKVDHWNQVRHFLQQAYPEVTSSELESTGGKIDDLIGLLHEKTDQSQAQIEALLEQCCRGAAEQHAQRSDASAQRSQHSVLHAATSGLDEQVNRRPIQCLVLSFAAGVLAASAMSGIWSHTRPPERSWTDRLRGR